MTDTTESIRVVVRLPAEPKARKIRRAQSTKGRVSKSAVESGLMAQLEDLRRRKGSSETRDAGQTDADARAINEEHRQARQHAESAVNHAIECGKLLVAVKAKLAHGEWLPWLAKHCPEIAERTVQAYMRLHRAVKDPAKAQRVADLSMRAAITELSEARTAVVSVERADRDAAQRETLYAPVSMPDLKQPAIPDQPKSPLPQVAGGVPIASPRASQEVVSQIDPIETRGQAKFVHVVADRAEWINAIKDDIKEYAKEYGWVAAQTALVPWIEDQV